MNTTKQQLTDACLLLAAGWTKGSGTDARYPTGRATSPMNSEAMKFSPCGAITRAAGRDGSVIKSRRIVADLVREEVFAGLVRRKVCNATDDMPDWLKKDYMAIDAWNNMPGRKKVHAVALFKRAIAVAS